MSGPTMGESTRRRLEGVVRSANAGGDGRAAGQYVGGWAGGMGGTWGKAATGRGDVNKPRDDAAVPTPKAGLGAGQPASSPMARPSSAGRVRAPSDPGFSPLQQPSQGGGILNSQPAGRPKIRPASAGVKNVWDTTAQRLPKAPPHGMTHTKAVKPQSATMKATKPMAGLATMEYKLHGNSLDPQYGGGGGSGAAGRGGGSGLAAFGAPRDSGSSYAYGAPRPYGAMAAAAGPSSSYAADGSPGGSAVPQPAQLTEAHLAMLEDAIRDAIRAKRSVYEGSKEMLLKLFKAVDDGSGDVSHDEFCRVCAQVGVSCSLPEAKALFKRFGYSDVMPYQKFATTLLTQPSRQLAEEMPVRKGAFVAGQSATFQGKILYEHCRKPVYTPSDWDPALAERSAELPLARLVLDFVYGYQGKDATSQNLFYTGTGQVVYFTAGIGVVYSRRPAHSQHFFLGHNDDVKALALCPAAIDVGGRQYPAKTLVATGQVTAHENGPVVCVWDSRVGSQQGDPELVRIPFDKDARGITALAFSPDGTKLTVVTTDNSHTVYIYDWRRQRVLGNGKGQMGDPPQVLGVEWCPYEASHGTPPQFVTFGKKHIKLWTRTENSWSSRQLTTGRLPMQNVHSAAWLPPRSDSATECLIVAGMADGQLYVFKGTSAIKGIAAHRPGPREIQFDGHVAYPGLRGMRLCKGNKVLLTGGADGTILQWDVSDGSIQDARFAGPALQLRSPYGTSDVAIMVRSLDYSEERGTVLAGTSQCDVVEVSETDQDVLIYGHSADTWFIAWHPTKPNVCATVADSSRVYVWDTDARDLLKSAVVGFTARAVGFSPALPDSGAHHLAVGGAKGNIRVLNESDLRPVAEMRDSKEGISDLKYSPDGRYLAAATFDTWIDIYNVAKGYARVARCSGHSSTVRGVDWSTDSSIIQSDAADLELLVWNARTGKQIPIPSRDMSYHTYTCRLGFPVMGIWADGADGTDVNAVDRSKDGQLLVTSDDEGLVKLFNYPCVVEDAPHRAYRGHSSHVMCVRFNCNDSLVVSVGGMDWAMFQFKLVYLDREPQPEPEPEPVWGALDDTGRNFGYTRNPAQLAPGVGPSSMGQPLMQVQGSPASHRGQGAHMPQIREEPSRLSTSAADFDTRGPGAVDSRPVSRGGFGAGEVDYLDVGASYADDAQTPLSARQQQQQQRPVSSRGHSPLPQDQPPMRPPSSRGHSPLPPDADVAQHPSSRPVSRGVSLLPPQQYGSYHHEGGQDGDSPFIAENPAPLRVHYADEADEGDYGSGGGAGDAFHSRQPPAVQVQQPWQGAGGADGGAAYSDRADHGRVSPGDGSPAPRGGYSGGGSGGGYAGDDGQY